MADSMASVNETSEFCLGIFWRWQPHALYAGANKVWCQAAQPESDPPGNFPGRTLQAIALANWFELKGSIDCMRELKASLLLGTFQSRAYLNQDPAGWDLPNSARNTDQVDTSRSG